MSYYADWLQRRLEDGTASDRDLQRLVDGELSDALAADHYARPSTRAQAAPRDEEPDEIREQLRSLARRP